MTNAHSSPLPTYVGNPGRQPTPPPSPSGTVSETPAPLITPAPPRANPLVLTTQKNLKNNPPPGRLSTTKTAKTLTFGPARYALHLHVVCSYSPCW